MFARKGTPIAAPRSMKQQLKPNTPSAPDAPVNPPVADQNAATQSHAGSDAAGAQEEENYEEPDPHPDTPDDFDEDAVGERESIEAVIGG
jgi:hypothetical protein